MAEDPNEDIADAWAAALEEQKETEAGAGPDSAAAAPAGAAGRASDAAGPFDQVERVSPEDFSANQSPAASDVNLDLVLDVPVTIAMEIGRTRIPIRNLLQLNQGSVVELDRLAGEPLDVLVNGTLIAHGEVVVVNEKFGIRLTDVISPSERVRKLR